MDPSLAQDEAATPAVLQATCTYALEILQGMEQRPAAIGPPSAAAPAATPLPLPDAGQGFAAALEDFQTRWAARLSGSAGPRYLGFVVGGSTPAALAGDWLCSALDQNPQTTMDTQATWLEREALGWLRDLLGLSAVHRGSFVSGATQSNTVGLAIAREWCGQRARGLSVSEVGLAALGPVRVLSGCPHSSVYKALSILGLGKASMAVVPLVEGREAVDVAALEAALADNPQGLPTIVVANAGTVNTGACVRTQGRGRRWLRGFGWTWGDRRCLRVCHLISFTKQNQTRGFRPHGGHHCAAGGERSRVLAARRRGLWGVCRPPPHQKGLVGGLGCGRQVRA